eukprot:3379021-Amphidinium_carterae.1
MGKGKSKGKPPWLGRNSSGYSGKDGLFKGGKGKRFQSQKAWASTSMLAAVVVQRTHRGRRTVDGQALGTLLPRSAGRAGQRDPELCQDSDGQLRQRSNG